MSRTLRAKSSSSVTLTAAGGGGGGATTVTRAVASCVPPGPLAVRRQLVESLGVTCCDPLRSTLPTPSMFTSVAFSVRQVTVKDSPRCTVFGFALMLAVGAGGGGGGGGGGAASFFLQAVTSRRPARATIRVHFALRCFTSSSRCACAPLLHFNCVCPTELLRIHPKLPACQQAGGYLALQFGIMLAPPLVSGFCCVPSASIVHICGLPERVDWNTMCLPSGAHDG